MMMAGGIRVIDGRGGGGWLVLWVGWNHMECEKNETHHNHFVYRVSIYIMLTKCRIVKKRRVNREDSLAIYVKNIRVFSWCTGRMSLPCPYRFTAKTQVIIKNKEKWKKKKIMKKRKENTRELVIYFPSSIT